MKELKYAKSNANKTKIAFAKRKRNLGLGLLGLIIAIFAISIANSNASTLKASATTAAIALAPLAWIGEDKKFKKLSPEDLNKLSDDEINDYSKALSKFNDEREAEIAKRLGELDTKNEAHKVELEALKAELNGINSADIREMLKAVKEQGDYLKKLKDNGGITTETFKSKLKFAFDSQMEKLNGLKTDRNATVKFSVDKIANYGDIDSGLDFAQMRTSITNIPVRKPSLRELFRTLPVSTEFFKYVEQLTCVRDAQNVASQTAPTTKNTKETLKVNSIQTKIIKSIIPFCRDFVSDYPFMESRINLLLNEAIALQFESQLLNGTGAGLEMYSVNWASSEFNAANAVANVAAKIQDASYVDLILSMSLQINMLGKLGSYNADTVLVNKVDWFLYAESRKDANNNYLDARITYINGIPYVGGLMVKWLTTDLLAQNKMYVFDSTKGEIVDRMDLTVEVSYENNDNWEKEIAELKGYERANFLVEDNNKNAFMKCSDVATAIAAIKKP